MVRNGSTFEDPDTLASLRTSLARPLIKVKRGRVKSCESEATLHVHFLAKINLKS